jgi:hypothetical protein
MRRRLQQQAKYREQVLIFGRPHIQPEVFRDRSDTPWIPLHQHLNIADK